MKHSDIHIYSYIKRLVIDNIFGLVTMLTRLRSSIRYGSLSLKIGAYETFWHIIAVAWTVYYEICQG